MLAENIFIGAVASTVIVMLGGFFGVLWFMQRRANSDTIFAPPYPFDDPNFVHVGLTPTQREALKVLALELCFMQWVPHHANAAIDCTYYAMTREEFKQFYEVLTKHVRVAVADAAKNHEPFLRGDAFTLSVLLIGLAEVRASLFPEGLPVETHTARPPPIDTVTV